MASLTVQKNGKTPATPQSTPERGREEEGGVLMREYPGNLDPSKARNLAVFGAMVTGVVGVGMAIFSVVGGEEAGGAGLLAASALAFGLLV